MILNRNGRPANAYTNAKGSLERTTGIVSVLLLLQVWITRMDSHGMIPRRTERCSASEISNERIRCRRLRSASLSAVGLSLRLVLAMTAQWLTEVSSGFGIV
jgi:hypothetical protein